VHTYIAANRGVQGQNEDTYCSSDRASLVCAHICSYVAADKGVGFIVGKHVCYSNLRSEGAPKPFSMRSPIKNHSSAASTAGAPALFLMCVCVCVCVCVCLCMGVCVCVFTMRVLHLAQQLRHVASATGPLLRLY
jgi:hypothetical protein